MNNELKKSKERKNKNLKKYKTITSIATTHRLW